MRAKGNRFGLVVVLGAVIYAALRLFLLIDRYAVNILFWDQWDLYNALFTNHNVLELFRWQHGPHRQGFGFLLTKAVAELSGWDTRAEVFFVGGVLCLATGAALGLKARLFRSLSWADAVIPFLFLTPLQWEALFNTPNPAHGSVPLLLIILYCLAWTLSNRAARYAMVLVLNFLVTFTGFGVFLGVVTPLVLLLECAAEYRNHNPRDLLISVAALVLSCLSLGSFFVGYTFSPAVDRFQFPIPEYWQYPQFLALSLAGALGLRTTGHVSLLLGAAVFLTLLGIGAYHTGLLLIDRREIRTVSLVILILSSFSILFSINLAVGRVSLGLAAAQRSRYFAYLIPAFLGLYFHVASLSPGRKQRLLLVTCLVTALVAFIPLPQPDGQEMVWLSDGKQRWKDTYLMTEDIQKAAEVSGIMIYPWPEATRLKWKLDYLKARNLNLYRDRAAQLDQAPDVTRTGAGVSVQPSEPEPAQSPTWTADIRRQITAALWRILMVGLPEGKES